MWPPTLDSDAPTNLSSSVPVGLIRPFGYP